VNLYPEFFHLEMCGARRNLLVLCHQNFCKFGCVKAPGLDDRKASCIELILRALRSFNRGSFHISPTYKNFDDRALAASESERINQMEKGSCVNSQKQTASGIILLGEKPHAIHA